ncbi:hypothetical protein C0Q70_19119 [Pomacea canaliculata]|uniref:Uncharacterized protein n=1 Tax=Pomacea canaliculata TaxID=400727 RepID=A0A2T7NII3_POMCA|nr:hypothetical protein C0Q70_19119 [Pomacea canaliculata]
MMEKTCSLGNNAVPIPNISQNRRRERKKERKVAEHLDNDRDLKERIINVEDEEESCSSFKDHDFDNDDDLSASEESSRRLIRDRSPLRGSRDKGEGGSSPSSSEKLLLEGERRAGRGDEHSSRVLG